jgi:hypothetical protein
MLLKNNCFYNQQFKALFHVEVSRFCRHMELNIMNRRPANVLFGKMDKEVAVTPFFVIRGREANVITGIT